MNRQVLFTDADSGADRRNH